MFPLVPERSLCHFRQDSNKHGYLVSNHIIFKKKKLIKKKLKKKNGVWGDRAQKVGDSGLECSSTRSQ